MTMDKQLYGLRILRTGFVICFQSFDTKVIFAKRLKYFNTANPKINSTGFGGVVKHNLLKRPICQYSGRFCRKLLNKYKKTS